MNARPPATGPTPNPPTPLSPAEVESIAGFLVKLARALHTYGTPSHRTEEALTRIAERLGLRAQFLVTPTSILGSFGEDEFQITRLARVDAGETDLQKLTRLHEVIRDVFAGTMSPREAREVVERIVKGPASYRWPSTLISFALTSGAAARFFDGGLAEILVSTVIGLIVGLLVLVSASRERVRRLGSVLGGVIAAAGATAMAHQADVFAPIVILASLIVLLPGFTLTLAMNELALGHVVSGSARLTGATVTFLQLGFGVALGSELVRLLMGPAPSTVIPGGLHDLTIFVALAVAAGALTVIFRARVRDAFVILPMSAVAFFGARLGSQQLGPELGAALGALLLGVCSNLLSRRLDQPTAIALMPALLLLVPGSLGFRSLQSLLAHDVLAGVETAFTMALVAVGLVSGLLVANVAVSPRRLL